MLLYHNMENFRHTAYHVTPFAKLSQRKVKSPFYTGKLHALAMQQRHFIDSCIRHHVNSSWYPYSLYTIKYRVHSTVSEKEANPLVHKFRDVEQKKFRDFQQKGSVTPRAANQLMTRVWPLGPWYLSTWFLPRKKPARKIHEARKAQHFDLE
jgi:hypothetical protein